MTAGRRVGQAVESVTAFIPCCDNEATIAWVVRATAKALDELEADAELVVVNDGSTDGSQEVLEELADEIPTLRIVVHESNRGYGSAIRSGLVAATKQWVFYTAGDGRFDAGALPALVERASDDVDVVQGYRGARVDRFTGRVARAVYQRVVSTLFRIPLRDFDCDFRLIRRSRLDGVDLEHETVLIRVELVARLLRAGARFTEVPVRELVRSERSRPLRPRRILGELPALWMRVVLRRAR